jgi:hypothetical protein
MNRVLVSEHADELYEIARLLSEEIYPFDDNEECKFCRGEWARAAIHRRVDIFIHYNCAWQKARDLFYGSDDAGE